MRDEFRLVVGTIGFIGWGVITYYFFTKALNYLDEVVAASKQLVADKDQPIVLPEAIKIVQDELNLFREQALRNELLAKEAEQRKNDLVVYLAHDLKTPLTSVIGYLTLLRDERQISPELREKYLSISLDKAERLEDLINEFFEITRFNLSASVLQYRTVNLTRLLEQLIFEFQPMLSSKNLTCQLHSRPDTSIKCDVDKIQRVFDNLLRNAVFYSFEGGSIQITVVENQRDISIKFINPGDTIPEEKLERIFEQFYRLDTARGSNSGGAGLGLAIAKEIVGLHKGTIRAESKNELIEFDVNLPLL
ncbi:HAMP domain-containing histidine kinase [Aminipila butyrica]|uniref:histidine kinase n=2 Tax=Aminipila butyrica TaxID=433296 RepID=A0A858BZM6_9FIRM|nr:HAMP domain-containing histidine kinase [Aminipila butyrica]